MARMFDMHVHTTRGSSDSRLSPEEMVLEAEQLGFLGLCITEHGGPWDEREFETFAAAHHLVLIRAMEADTDMGHVLTFGLDSDLPGITKVSELRRAVNEVGGVMVIAHPFRGIYDHRADVMPLLYKDKSSVPSTVEDAAGHPVFGLVDAVEVANGINSDKENRFAMEVARHIGLKITGGSDAHDQHRLGSCVTIFEREIGSQAELLNAIRTGSFYPAVLARNNRDPAGSWLPVPEPFAAD